MARGRMIDKRISMSKKIGHISDSARVLYFMLYPHLDCEGRVAFEDIEDLKDEIIPKFKGWTLKKIGKVLNELADIELIHLYPNKSKIAMQFNRFDEFQTGIRKDREAPSKIDSPEVAPENSGVFRITPALRLNIRLRKEGRKEVISFNEEEKKFLNITDEHKKFWKDAFPACDINQELKRMSVWIIANPEKGKKSNWERFITNWLKRTQDSGGTKKSYSSNSDLDAWARGEVVSKRQEQCEK